MQSVKLDHPIKEFRVKRGLTQDGLAALLGVTGMTVYRWEKGERVPRREQRTKIARITGITAEQLIRAADGMVTS